MAAKEPRDFKVSLDWPENEARRELSPAPTHRKSAHGRPDAHREAAERPGDAVGAGAEAAATEGRARRRALGPADLATFLRRLDAVSQRLEATSGAGGGADTAALEQIGERVDKVARTVGPLPKAVKTLSDRVEQVSSTVRVLPTATAVAELTGRVDTLVEAVRAITSMYVAGTDRVVVALDEVSSQLRDLDGAAQNVRRLAAHFGSVTASRAARQNELQAEVDALAGDLEALQGAFPARRAPATPPKRTPSKSTRKRAPTTKAKAPTAKRARRTPS
jgi:uncharacterized protein YoxC